MDCIARCLFDRLHFFLASGMIEWADHNRLSDDDVSRGREMCLFPYELATM